ncbi:head-tail connector protein [Ruminiclostridium cellobioparum]|uniref:Putative phage protein (Possible DNA packaging) n=1 Tax=Ruminiclostridium cellobioparum subsp. termitidis CT1112 TaxID=1195236 RepID=S0FZR8_RUMCE|nr:head-tail connector protein [Ruminiclostridium cellobioparum]EMS74038.1 putative phage protein (possible DNA packaging) [Ruminiclostridium cellobioparum subsp. termitidis CT1112]
MTLSELKLFLRIDNEIEDIFLAELIETSQIYIDSCVGSGYKKDVKAVKLAELVQKKIINDLYENRSANIPDKTKQDTIVTTILDKLSLFSEVSG